MSTPPRRYSKQGQIPRLHAGQVRQIQAWAALGVDMTEVGRKFGIGRAAVAAYIKAAHKREYRPAPEVSDEWPTIPDLAAIRARDTSRYQRIEVAPLDDAIEDRRILLAYVDALVAAVSCGEN